VYFPETAVVAMIDTLEDGGTVEVGIIGHDISGLSGHAGQGGCADTRQCIENEDE
jgi:hypothetical protein